MFANYHLVIFTIFKQDFKIWVCSLSLDDIERMAALHMNESSDSQ